MLKINYRQKKKRPMEEPKGLKKEEVKVNVGVYTKKENGKNGKAYVGLTNKVKEQEEFKGMEQRAKKTEKYRKEWEDKNEVDRYIYEKMIKKTEKIEKERPRDKGKNKGIGPTGRALCANISLKEKEQKIEAKGDLSGQGTIGKIRSPKGIKGIKKEEEWKEEYKKEWLSSREGSKEEERGWRKISGAKGYISKTETKEGKEKKSKGKGIIEIGGKIKGTIGITKGLGKITGTQNGQNNKNGGTGILTVSNNQQGKQIIQGGINKGNGGTKTQIIGGKGIEIEYSKIMKIKKKYKGEYVNKAQIYEMLSGLCKKTIKWEEEKEKEIKEKIKNSIETDKDMKEQENPFGTKEQKTKGENGKNRKEDQRGTTQMTELMIKKEEEEEEKEISLSGGNWRKTKEEGKKISNGGRSNGRSTNGNIIPKRNKLTCVNKKEKEGKEKRERTSVNPIKWISKAYIVNEGGKKGIGATEEEETKEQIENKSEKQKTERKIKGIEYIIKTKNMYGAIQYLKNYWKNIENKYFPKKGGKPTKKIQLISTSWNAIWLKEKGNKKCIIKRKLLEQKMKKIIEKQNKKPIIGVWGNKEGGKIGNKKMKSTKIVKEEIMFIDAVKTMENIKW